MPFKPALFFCLFITVACSNTPYQFPDNKTKSTVTDAVPEHSTNIYAAVKDIPLPGGYQRLPADSNSFACWLQHVSLKEHNTVYLFNGEKKVNQQAQFAVLDISIGNENLQQCADAVIRLRAEFLFTQKMYDQIVFTDNEKGIYAFASPYTRINFMKYMKKVFGMCGSASLAKQLKQVTNFENITAGDVLIRGGFPGHAVMVMAVAENTAGKKIFMLAQSYMPAQDIHILVNPTDEKLSPWYEVNDANRIFTPEYLFYKNELKTW